MNKFRYIIPLFALLMVSISPISVYAQEELSEESQPKDVNYSTLESIGLQQSQFNRLFDGGIYNGVKRSEITHLLKNIRKSQWIALEHAINDLLLSTADVTSVNNDIDIKEGQDLLTLRINALLKRGLYKDAFNLYTKSQDEAVQEDRARLGILAMLMSGEKALACLEVKTLISHFQDIPFWQEFEAYCTLSLSGTAEDIEANQTIKSKIAKMILSYSDYRFEYDQTTFSALSFFERALLTAEDRITFMDVPADKYENIPYQDVIPLLNQSMLSNMARLYLMVRGIRHGLISPDVLVKYYKQIYDNNSEKGKTSTSDLDHLASLYTESKEGWSSKEIKGKLEKLFNISESHDILVLLPFLDIFGKMDIGDEISLPFAKKILSLFLYENRDVPKHWTKTLKKLSFEDKELENIRFQAIFISMLLSKSNRDDLFLKDLEHLNHYLKSSIFHTTLKNIIENIDRGTNNSDKFNYIYENDFDLMLNKGYTMPPSILLDELKNSSKNQNFGAVLLLSAATLGEIKHEELYPGTLGDVILALSNTGLKRISRRIMGQAVLEMKN